ncbi:MAG: NnrS family protein [Pseudomonadota bacterium]|nr:NnrS family protein [Pseudomonadota bacterium]
MPSHSIERLAPSGPPASQSSRDFALWNLGFRPFYLLASIFAAVSILLWIAGYAGYIPRGYLRDPVWHAHEMLFGYTIAVITGFLFTAARNWTGRPTPTGPLLAGYALLWVAGRISVLTPYPVAAALLNAAFPIAVAIGLAVPLARSGNRRNYFFVALLALLGVVTFAVHAARLGFVAWPQRATLQIGLDIVLFIIAVMSGRVIPMFTNNGIPGVHATRNALVEKASLGGILLLIAADFMQFDSSAIAVLAIVVALLHAVRLWLWQPWRTASTPLVWILHVAYGWIVVYLVLRALAAWGYVAAPLAVHALTIGTIGGMTMGMMTRTARGHSGLPLAADRFEITCYALIQLAALVRVFGGMALPDFYRATVVVSGLCWSSAFALYAIRYWPILTRPRLDGKPG